MTGSSHMTFARFLERRGRRRRCVTGAFWPLIHTICEVLPLVALIIPTWLRTTTVTSGSPLWSGLPGTAAGPLLFKLRMPPMSCRPVFVIRVPQTFPSFLTRVGQCIRAGPPNNWLRRGPVAMFAGASGPACDAGRLQRRLSAGRRVPPQGVSVLSLTGGEQAGNCLRGYRSGRTGGVESWVRMGRGAPACPFPALERPQLKLGPLTTGKIKSHQLGPVRWFGIRQRRLVGSVRKLILPDGLPPARPPGQITAATF